MAKQNAFERFKGTPGYIASGPLVDAVNCAIALERPLLIKGEPGTGKTVLARHVAEGLGMPLINWHIKSTTKAIDGLYVYDTVQRLNDSRFGSGDVSDIARYIKLGPIGQAFAAETRQVLLIDEVDKADLEFPNDLLHELDEMRFNITETGEEVVAKERPVVIITSNNEKELPDAFLRRCIFHFIEFPDRNLMKQIVAVHHKNLDAKLLDQVSAAQAEAIEHLAAQGIKATTVVATGDSWPEALASVPFAAGDVMVVGSSSTHKLANVFLGSSAAKILRNSTVPVMVVP